MSKKSGFLLVTTLFLVMAVSLGSWSASGPIKIGVIAPLSGAGAYDGRNVANAVMMAAKEINASGGVLGRQLELIIEDNESNPDASVAAISKLILRDRVCAVQGAFYSTCTKAIMPIAKRERVPLVSAASTAASLTVDPAVQNEWFFRVVSHDGMASHPFSKYFIEELGLRRIAFLYESGEWGRGIAAFFIPEIQKLGGEVVVDEIYTMGDTDYTPFLTRIAAKKPDALFFVGTSSDGAAFARDFHQMGLSGKMEILSAGTLSTDVFMSLAKEYAEGIYGVCAYADALDTPENLAFIERYAKLYPGMPRPDKHVWGPYTAIYVIAQAIEKAGSDSPAAIWKALELVSYKGVTGTIEFDEFRQAWPNIYITKNVNGKAELVAEVPTR